CRPIVSKPLIRTAKPQPFACPLTDALTQAMRVIIEQEKRQRTQKPSPQEECLQSSLLPFAFRGPTGEPHSRARPSMRSPTRPAAAPSPLTKPCELPNPHH